MTREVLSDAKTIAVKRPASTAQARGDLMYFDSGYAKSASTRADQGSLSANQLDFAPLFLGINQDVRIVGETDAPERVLVTEGVADFDCASATWAIGDLIAIDRSGTPKNYDQQVIKTTDPNGAIGVCIKPGTSVTTVRGFFQSKMLLMPPLGTTLATTVALTDNTGAAFQFAEGANVYMTFDTTDSAEVVSITKKLELDNATTPILEFASGMTNTGYINLKGKTSGTLKITTADATAQTLTFTAAAQTSGAATVSIPDCAGVNQTLVTLALAQTLTNKTLTSPVIGTGLTASGSAANTFAGSTGTFITSSGLNTISGKLNIKAINTAVAATGAGGGVAGAAALGSANVVKISSDGATKGVKMLTSLGGEVVHIINTSGTAANLFAAAGGTINGGSADAGCAIPASKGVLALSTAADTWWVFDFTAAAGAAA